MNGWTLPESALIGGRNYRINADFRDVLEVIETLNNTEEDEAVKRYVAMSLFFDEFETMPEEEYVEAFLFMAEFISAGEEDDGVHRPKLIDWEQDRNIIASEVNKVAGTEVRALKFLHWWTFLGYFSCIGDGQLALIVSIREKKNQGKKLEKFEQEFYRKNRSRVDLKQHITNAEQEVLSKWEKAGGKRGGVNE
jgi:hypothetical protein